MQPFTQMTALAALAAGLAYTGWAVAAVPPPPDTT